MPSISLALSATTVVAGLADSPASKPFLDCDGTKPYADADNASKKHMGGATADGDAS